MLPENTASNSATNLVIDTTAFVKSRLNQFPDKYCNLECPAQRPHSITNRSFLGGRGSAEYSIANLGLVYKLSFENVLIICTQMNFHCRIKSLLPCLPLI